jgi:prepilin-type processing-associated H-X9-DG protein
MNELTTIAVDAPRIPEQAVPERRRWPWSRIAFWSGMAGLAGLVLAVVSAIAVADMRASQLNECAARLKQIGLAMHQYQGANGHFPAPTLSRSDGTPLLSWRVALLPQLGYRSLYDRFHRDEPWDSPHNLALMKEMPAVFQCPGDGWHSSGRTRYQVMVGPETEPTSVNTPFEPTRGVDLREITDGTSNTALVFEASAAVPWTRPDDLRWEKGGPLPRLASPHDGGAHVLFADGSTRFVKATISPEILLAIVTINGGEVTGG